MKQDQTFWKCDRCGEERTCSHGTVPPAWRQLTISNMPQEGRLVGRSAQLCADCVKTVEKWLDHLAPGLDMATVTDQ